MTTVRSIRGKKVETAKETAVSLLDSVCDDINDSPEEPVVIAIVVVHRDGSLSVRAAGSTIAVIGALEAGKLQLLLDESDEE